MTKVSIIGAGNVGVTCANVLATRNVAKEIILLDVKEGVAEGKAMDLRQAVLQWGSSTKITGVTRDYSATAESDIVVITSGVPRKPGQTREEMLAVNGGILNECIRGALQYSPDAILIPITNPVDTLTYHTWNVMREINPYADRHKVLGLGGALDSARFRFYLEEKTGYSSSCFKNIFVIGGHGDTTMVPVTSSVKCVTPIRMILSEEELQEIVEATKVGGATLTKHLGTSAWQGPGTALARMVESILQDKQEIFPCIVPLEGEYGQEDICIGVPVVLGKGGWKRIVKLDLSKAEEQAFKASAEAVRKVNKELTKK
ncbi:MAG: malate dehydrogenase [Candidatus Peribacteria bacterium]|jgi:malate dehydrogenase|nr:malate dehydrogenase [Candidatus Peribacteria bacterium]